MQVRNERFVGDAAGPETFTFEELLRLLASAVGYALSRLVGLLLRDVVLKRDEVDGLIAVLLTSDAVPARTSTLGGWLTDKEVALDSGTFWNCGLISVGKSSALYRASSLVGLVIPFMVRPALWVMD